MNNAILKFERPKNEPSMNYAPGSPERELVKEAIAQISSEVAEIPLIIGGEPIYTGDKGNVVMPHDH